MQQQPQIMAIMSPSPPTEQIQKKNAQSGTSLEFRIVRDNRVNQNSFREKTRISSVFDFILLRSPGSQSSGAVGAIKREVGVVGARKQPSANTPKNPTVTPLNSSLGKDVTVSSGLVETSTALNKRYQVSQPTVDESVISSGTVSSILTSFWPSKSVLAPPSPTENVNPVDLLDASSRKSESDAPASGHGTSYTPAEPQEPQGHSEISSFQCTTRKLLMICDSTDQQWMNLQRTKDCHLDRRPLLHVWQLASPHPPWQ
ncbi:hypothetical protein MKW98_032754 [Papaver atlanticum]|uniref:Uncharacterized protein n=1 Tax=Papaver atlanticum TaxID=357466 RepID=A0AAD4RZJ0_9MAGN|nr:hypothetical protein MKW98_032754 [Papaver atlanticum]